MHTCGRVKRLETNRTSKLQQEHQTWQQSPWNMCLVLCLQNECTAKLLEALGKLATKANNSRGAEWKDVLFFCFCCKSMNHQIPSKKHLWTHKPMVKMGQNEHAAMIAISRNQRPCSTSCLMQYMFYSKSSGSVTGPFPCFWFLQGCSLASGLCTSVID